MSPAIDADQYSPGRSTSTATIVAKLRHSRTLRCADMCVAAPRARATVRRFLLGRPDHFAVGEEINPWMDGASQPCPDRVMAEWNGLLLTLQALGAAVEVVPACPGLTDLVFVRDAALVL